MTPAAWIAIGAAGVTVGIQLAAAVAIVATIRADVRNLREWVQRIDSGLDDHIAHHPHGDD